MMVYDLIMIVVLIAATLWGIYKGLAWQIASLGSIIASYFVAYQFRGQLAYYIDADPPWNNFLAMLILYLGTSLLVWIAFRIVKNSIDRVKLQEFDSHVGGVLGLAKGVVLCVIITLFAVTLLGQKEQEHIAHSHSGYYIALLLYHSHAVIPEEVHDEIHPLVHSLDHRLPSDYEPHHEHGQPSPHPAGTPVPSHPSPAPQPTFPHGGGGVLGGTPHGHQPGHTAEHQPTGFDNR